jgi:Uma2 family endonuclease
METLTSIAFRPAHDVSDGEIEELTRRNPTLRFERSAEGELIVSPPTGGSSGAQNSELGGQLRDWNGIHRLGYVFDSSTGFRIPSGALYSPDASWVAAERWHALTPDDRSGYVPLAPDAVFELLSPSDIPGDPLRKLREFLADGSRLGALLDPFERCVTVLLPGVDPIVLSDPIGIPFDDLDRSRVLPGFVLDARAVFTAAA